MNTATAAFYRWENNDLLLTCRLLPRSSKDEFAGIHADLLKIRIKAPPVDGKANQHLIQFLAKQFKVPKKQVQIINGETARNKRVRIENPTALPDAIPELRPATEPRK
ncbi:MAG: YggU family protein [Pseudomonadales bacterium]|nr:YggU family protein [Pseudomonadales bacterium]